LNSRFDLVKILQTALWVITSPVKFFSSMPRSGGYVEPLIFMIVMGFIGASLQALSSISGFQSLELDIDPISLIITLTFVIVISGFIAAAIYFAIWKLMGSRESFETAYRCNAYISALIPITTLLNLIPFFAPVLSILLSTVFLVIASVYVHNLPPRKSWIVFGVLGLMFLMFSLSSDLAVKQLKGSQEPSNKYEEIHDSDEDVLRNLKDI
jgi:hypothetical protein